jgi:hypothetical protein
MQVDAYQYCPCGSGKKIKFCKCADNFKDLDKIDRMISGGQLVAALDRINQLLQTTPSAAWLLALKAQILFQLREFESLTETANRFWRLKPDNQLALWLMTISETVREPSILSAAKYFLDGISEVRDVIHPFGQTAGLMLAERLAMEGQYLSALLITDLLGVLFKSEEPAQFMEELSRERGISTLMRITPNLHEKVGTVSWGERLQEVRSLFRSHRIPQAYSKLQSLNREFADQPVLLSMLVICELYRCDSAAAARYSERLAKNEGLSLQERAYYQALAFTLAPTTSGVCFQQHGMLFDLTAEQEEHITRLLNEMPVFEAWVANSEEARQELALFIGEEVGPKLLYHFFTKHKVPLDGNLVESEVSSGLIALFGKQTDHPARMLLRYTDESRHLAAEVDELLKTFNLNRGDSKFPRKDELLPVTIQSALTPYLRNTQFTEQTTEAEINSLRQKLRATIRERIKIAPLSSLDGKTVAEAAGTAAYQIKLLGLLLYLLALEDGTFTAADFDKLAEDLQVSPIPHIVPGETLSNISPADLYFIDVEQVPAKAVLPFASYVFEMKLYSRFPALIQRLEKPDVPNDPPGFAAELLLMLKFSSAETLEERMEAVEKLIVLFAEAKKPVGQLVMSGVNTLFAAGRAQEGQAMFTKYFKKYPDDPMLQAFVQQLMAQAPPAMQPLSPTVPMGPGADSNGGLWVPGQSSPEASPASSGGSKLWLPGME